MDWAEMEYWGSRNRNSVIEQAKEELEILELQHPNKYEYLKTELKAFISDFEVLLVLPNIKTYNTISTTCPSVATQESSSSSSRRKKRKKVICFVEDDEASRGKVGSYMKRKRCKTTDAVLERAQQCLQKIQHLKTTL